MILTISSLAPKTCNKYFVEVGIKLAEKIDNPPTNYKINYPQIKESMFLKPVDRNEIVSVIKSLKENSSPGHDQITSKLIKKFHINILTPLVHIINLIFQSGEIPEQFKISIVSPIYKNGNKNHITNYRPISLINTTAKVFEKCLKVRLNEYLMKGDIPSGNQYDFKQDTSTCDAMFELLYHVKSNNNNNNNNNNTSLFLITLVNTLIVQTNIKRNDVTKKKKNISYLHS